MSDKPLKNQKHELFAQHLARGETGDAAYRLAGFKPNRGNASELKSKQNIRDRVAAIQAKGADAVSVSTEQIVRELARIGFSDLRKAVKWGPSRQKIGDDKAPGVVIIDSDDLDDDTAAAIAEVSQTKDGLKIKLHDKRAALVDLGRYKGMFKDEPGKAGDIHIHVDALLKGVL